MTDQTKHGAFISSGRQPEVFTQDIGIATLVQATIQVRRPDGSFAALDASAVIQPGQTVTPNFMTHPDGTHTLELLDQDGTRRALASLAPQPAPEPWPRTQVVPPGVWTDLIHGSGSVLHETDANATVTVDEDGTLTFSAPMSWRPEADYDEEARDDDI